MKKTFCKEKRSAEMNNQKKKSQNVVTEYVKMEIDKERNR